MGDAIPEALPLGPEDDEKRAFAWEVMKSSNEVVVGFARLMSATSLTAIGVLLSLAQFTGVNSGTGGWRLVLLSLACAGYLVATLMFSYVVRGRRINTSPDDYDDVVEQFLSAARARHRMTTVALGVFVLATSCGLAVLLEAIGHRA